VIRKETQLKGYIHCVSIKVTTNFKSLLLLTKRVAFGCHFHHIYLYLIDTTAVNLNKLRSIISEIQDKCSKFCVVKSTFSVCEFVHKSIILYGTRKREISDKRLMYSLSVLKVCHGLSWRVDAWNYSTHIVKPDAKITDAYYRNVLLAQNLLPFIRFMAG